MTKNLKPVKPYPSFPLTPHQRGWCKKIKGKVIWICGLQVQPQQALDIYFRKMVELAAAKPDGEPAIPTQPVVPVPLPHPSLTVPQLKDLYLANKREALMMEQLTDRSYMSIREVIPPFAAAVKKAVAALTSQDFATYRCKLAKRYSPYALDRHVTMIRAMFNWAYRNDHIIALPKWGDSFDKPTAVQKRKHRQQQTAKHGKKLFSPAEIQLLINTANPMMKAMVLLGINCALGNTDVAKLPVSAIDFERGLLEYPRVKTAQERRAYLWPETLRAIREAIVARPLPADPKHKHLLFLTREGHPLVRNRLVDKDGDVSIRKSDTVAWAFSQLRAKAKCQSRAGFYGLRHSFRTYVDACGDVRAINLVMGHVDGSTAGLYVEHVADERLRQVSDYLHQIVFEEAVVANAA